VSVIWGARLEGHEFDLEDWRDMFAPPFQPWVEVVPRQPGDMNVMRSSVFEDVTKAEEARDRAIPLIEQLNGAALLSRNCEPVVFAGAVRIQDDQISIHVFAEMHARARAHLRAVAVGLNANGEVMPPNPPALSDEQKWIVKAQQSDLVADLLTHLARATNWYDLYKAIELLEKIDGGEHVIVKRLGSGGEDWKSARATANCFRHAGPTALRT
jgi:hypothetical protein